MKARVIIADDHAIVRDGLKVLLNMSGEFEVVSEAADGKEAIDEVKKHMPDIVIMDSIMPNVDGMEATKTIIECCPDIKIIALSANTNRDSIIQMLESGAKGYVHKDCIFEEIKFAIKEVLSGNTYLSPVIADVVVKDYLDTLKNKESRAKSILTARETEVLQILASGKSNKEIAAILDISVKTVQTFVQQIMRKLSIDNVAGLTRYAIREGLTTL